MAGILSSKKWKRTTHVIYSVGASIVILGAMFKLLHLSIGPLTGESMLLVGLSTEAIIFLIFAFESPHKEYDWSLVYPELVGLEGGARKNKSSVDGFAQLNELFASANIDDNVMSKLGDGINRLESTASKLNDMSDAAIATNNYTNSMNNAAEAVMSLTKTTKDRIDSQADVQKNMGEVIENLAVSLEHSKTFRKETDELAKKLVTLNNVYGNMLSAMNVSK